MKPITIVLVDDHRVVTASLKAYLESFPEFRIAGIAASGEELLQHVAAWNPQVILQDLLMPGGMDGIEAIRRVQERVPAVKVIALTASTDEARMMGALRAGAAGYVRKDAEPEILLAAVRAVAAGRTYIDPSVGRVLLNATGHGNHETLSPRETEALRRIALGLSNKEIASALNISEETVKTHVASLFTKLQVENRAQAIVQALKRHLIDIDELN
ncbi:MAG: response regulator transcription factor [Acidobacteria bacterium]|nr:response regulator transcription factor [Acidobacteriota bacterium]